MFDSKRYKEAFSQVQASGETLSEVLNMTKKYRNDYGRRGVRMLLVAAVVVSLLATTVFAYVGFTQYENPMEMLKIFFGADEYTLVTGETTTYQDAYGNDVVVELPAEEKVPIDEEVAATQVAPYISDVGKSVVFDGYTLTVEAHLYDSATNCGVVYYTLENSNGVSGYEVFDDGEIWWPGGEMVYISDIGNGQGCYIVENETTQTKLAVAFYYCGADGLDSVSVAFYADESNALVLPLNDGGGMESISFADGSITLSPVALRVNAENMEFLYENADIYCDISRLVIRYADGTEYVLYSDEPYIDNTTYALNIYDGTVVSYTFNRLVDINAVEAIIINNVEFTDIQMMPQAQRDTAPEETSEVPPATEPANP